MVESQPSPTEAAFRQQSMGDAHLYDLYWQRERVMARAMSLMVTPTTSIPESLTLRLNRISHAISERIVKVEDFRLKAGPDDNYFHLLIEADDLRGAVAASPQDGDLFMSWDIANQAVRDYEAEAGIVGFTDSE